ncbi:MAG: aldo/keto reductase [Pseudomonadota bacterium]
MNYKTLGRTDLKVSTLCLGSMTWGSQNTEAEGHAQIDYALDHGINFIDTAEMYPANPGPNDPPGKTESYFGTWLARPGNRDKVVVASKCSGAGSARSRDGVNPTPPITAESIRIGLEGSLKRLQTDWIDLYQLHWPNRGSYQFRQNWNYEPKGERADVIANLTDVLEELGRQVDAGKIRHVGLSNESAWGTTQWVTLADQMGLPRMATVQNEYSLLCRLFDTDMAETCHHEDVDLLAFSPLACGILTGKYENGAVPEGSRMSINPTIGGRVTEHVWPAAAAYLAIARKHGLDPSQMALAFCLTRAFMGSAIFGATTMDQLATAVGAADVTLSEEVMAEIAAAHRAHPMPI